MAKILFIGVSTGNSLIHRAFPAWAEHLGLKAEIMGVDLPLGAAPEDYLRVVEDIRADADCLGAVVTTHKVALYQAAAQRFDALDEPALSCGEINSIRSSGVELAGFARDPISVGRVVDGIWPTSRGTVLCLGCGGTAIALGRHLLARGHQGTITAVDRDPAAVKRLAEALDDDRVHAQCSAAPWDETIAGLEPGALIVNATGMGKDRPGSPVTDAAVFPADAVVWELNYRGDLRMLDLARAQSQQRRLAVHDGWSLFCEGWAAALSAVLALPDDPQLGERFAALARDLRPKDRFSPR